MKSAKRKTNTQKLLLGIDGGGTRTVALLADESGCALRRAEFGPTNVKLLSDAQLADRFRAIARSFPKPDALGIGLAGVWLEGEMQHLRDAAAKAWPGVPCHACNDLEIALAAAKIKSEERSVKKHHRPAGGDVSIPQVLILSGTGSCCFGKDVRGRVVKMGGWGHVLGDKGSGFEIGLRALKAVVYYYDFDAVWPPLGRRLLRALQLNQPNDLIAWAHSASNAEIAGLATEVFAAWERGDRIARDILDGAAASLAKDAVRCASRLAARGRPVEFVVAGGTLLRQPRFARQVAGRLRRLWPNSRVTRLERGSVWGAVELAKRIQMKNEEREMKKPNSVSLRHSSFRPEVHATRPSPTEQRNPRSMNLHKLPIREAVELMWSEDAKITRALMAVRKPVERTIHAIVRAFHRGGRLFYVGAGTSGRLGVLDASECPVTFSTAPDLVQGIIAGGQPALCGSVEAAEDDAEAGARALEFRVVTKRDVVIGIAASGTTPFVWGALGEARQRHATTVLIAFNPFLKIPRALRPNICILPNIGPEILTGSTRLKAGTATKLILNTISTLAMVRLGKVVSNLMVDVVPSNVKLRDRATRIVQDLTGEDYAAARAALERSGWNIKTAISQPTARSRSGSV